MNMYRLDLVSLSLFQSVARSGSISRGATLAHLALGAASKRVADLEAALGVTLLERHSRGVTLTSAGQALLRHADQILNDVRQLSAELSDHAEGLQGVVRLWANTSAVIEFLPKDISSFLAAWPGIGIELEEGFSLEIVQALREGRADVGVFDELTAADDLVRLPYREDRLVVIASADHPIARRRRIRFEDMLDFHIVCLPKATALARRLQQQTEALGRHLKLRIRVRSFDAMCEMVAAGLGLAVLPAQAVRPHLTRQRLHLVELSEDWATRQLVLGLRDEATVPRHVRLFVEHLTGGGP